VVAVSKCDMKHMLPEFQSSCTTIVCSMSKYRNMSVCSVMTEGFCVQ